MYLGRHVVRHPASTLRPVAASRVRASTSTPWQMAPTGLPSRQKPATWSRSTGEPRYCRIPGAWPPGSSSPSKLAGSSSAHASVAENSGALVSSVVQAPGGGHRAQLAEQDTGQQPGVGGRDGPLAFGGEDDLVPGIAQDPPRHRDLRDVEVPVGQRHQNAHAGIISPVDCAIDLLYRYVPLPQHAASRSKQHTICRAVLVRVDEKRAARAGARIAVRRDAESKRYFL